MFRNVRNPEEDLEIREVDNLMKRHSVSRCEGQMEAGSEKIHMLPSLKEEALRFSISLLEESADETSGDVLCDIHHEALLCSYRMQLNPDNFVEELLETDSWYSIETENEEVWETTSGAEDSVDSNVASNLTVPSSQPPSAKIPWAAYLLAPFLFMFVFIPIILYLTFRFQGV